MVFVKPKTPKAEKPDPELHQELIATVLNSDLRDVVHRIEGMPTTAVVQHDGNIRQKPIPPGTEWLLSGMRQGVRGLIFEFQSVEWHEKWNHIEFREEKVFEALPSFETQLINALGDYETENWKAAKAAFFLDHVARAKRRLKLEEEKIRAELDNSYADDPTFGMF